MVPIEWSSRFSVNHPLLDAQHRRLLALCQRAAHCLDSDRAEYHDVINDLAAYAGEHFRVEEEMLRRSNYAAFEEHQAEHERYYTRLCGLLTDATIGLLDRERLSLCLEDWWTHHILDADMSYRDRLRVAGGERR